MRLSVGIEFVSCVSRVFLAYCGFGSLLDCVSSVRTWASARVCVSLCVFVGVCVCALLGLCVLCVHQLYPL